MAISKLGHNSHYDYYPLLAIMAGLNMAINMVFLVVFSKLVWVSVFRKIGFVVRSYGGGPR